MNMNVKADAQLLSSGSRSVEIRNVDVFYGTLHVLKNINLNIRAGEFFAFLGPSGCGKTTLLRSIAGFTAARRGEIVIGGENVLDLPPWKRDVGMVFQSYALWPHMTVRQNVAFGLEERRLPRQTIQEKVEAALSIVGLQALADRRPAQLSGGQQQRVALARTIAIEPKVLLLDEPLSNLDAKMRLGVRRELRELQQRLQLTTIFVTHDQEEANTVCDRIAVFNEGEIQQVGTPMELYERPANLFVASFLGTANILEGEVVGSGSGRVFQVPGAGVIPVPDAIQVPKNARAVFRPQSANIGDPSPEGVSLEGRIRHREFLGATIRYAVSVGEREVLVDLPFRAGDTLLDPGSRTVVGVRPSAVLWLAS